ncbi:hypothetical protein EGCR1_17560 (plasmid) [Enterococcus gilvus]|jgi:hypothetical protein|uniref:hypothetical protein n=1 Tax=Enterococcus gilvus TaxID=160453 RepID=UPI000DF5DBF8|nr:hypothetical protein [Enterococcus gilvus]AXG40508.1 hypothetical protein EGCR1_17560 [Enterococcus gilvus]
MNLSISDIIQLISIILSALLTIVSLVISVKALKQSQKSIELTEKSILDSNRPYVVIYRDYIQVLSTVHEYVIVKNFGNTGAVIDEISFSPVLLDDIRSGKVFDHLAGVFIAPGQSISTVTSVNVFKREKDLPDTNVSIVYHDEIKKYKNQYSFSDSILNDILVSKSKPSKNKSVQEVMSTVSEEILRRQL